jgi:acetyl-CoA carboxylase carboxyltransferase component
MDEVIDPHDTRRILIASLSAFDAKDRLLPDSAGWNPRL